MANPVLFLAQLNGSLAFSDRAGGGTLTGSGAVRYAPASGARWNLFKNPRFASSASTWTVVGTGSSGGRVADSDFVGGYAYELTTAGNANDGIGPSGTVSDHVGVVSVGSAYTVSFYAKLVSGSGAFYLEWTERNAAGTALSSGTTGLSTLGASVARYTFTRTIASTGAAFITYRVRQTGSGVNVARFSAFQLESGSTATDYFDGSTGGVWLDPITGILGTAHASPSVSQAVAWVEEGTTNTVPDPSFEAATITTNWTAENAATISKVTTHAYSGSNGGKVSCTATTLDGITQLTTSGSAAANGQPWTIQARVRAFASGDVGKTITLAICERTAANAFVKNNISGTFTLTDAWQLCSYTVTLSGGGTVAKVIAKIFNGAASAVDFVLDAVQLEQKAYATSYCDGSIGTGYAWSGTAHASSSTRTAVGVNINPAGRLNYLKGTIAARAQFKVTNGANQFVAMHHGASFTNRVYLYRNTGNRAAFRLGGSSEYAEAGTQPNDEAMLLTMSWSGAAGKVRKNAQTPALIDQSGSALTAVGTSFFIGSGSTSDQHLNGQVGPVLIADRPLTAKERATLNARTSWAWSLLKGRKLGRLTPI